MSLLCNIFGHRPYHTVNYRNPGSEYGVLSLGPVDGIDRMHCTVKTECARCGKMFEVVKIHLPGQAILNLVEEAEKKKEQYFIYEEE